MVADTDVQVWLDMVERVKPAVVVPYVQSNRTESLRFRVRVVQDGVGGRTVIGQAGAIHLSPGTPSALSRVALTRQAGSQCSIEIVLIRNYMKEEYFRFQCPGESTQTPVQTG